MSGDLRHETWENLARLTSENLTAEHLTGVLKQLLDKERLSDLSEDEAKMLLAALSPIPKLRHLVWEAVQTAVEINQAEAKAREKRPLVNVDATAAADIIGPEIINRIAALLLQDHQMMLLQREKRSGEVAEV